MLQHLQVALDALLSVAADVVVGGAAASADGYASTRAASAELRGEAALQELVGPAVYKLGHDLLADVERRAVPRFRAIREHPRNGREPLIDELDAAEVELNTAIHELKGSTGAASLLRVALAIVRVRAIATAMGVRAFADPRGSKTGNAPVQRRREIKPSDIGDDAARTVIAAIDAGDAWQSALEPLRAIEATEANQRGVATKILAFAEMPDGRAIIEGIAAKVRPYYPATPVSAPSDVSHPATGTSKVADASFADSHTAPAPLPVSVVATASREDTRRTAAEIRREKIDARRQQ